MTEDWGYTWFSWMVWHEGVPLFNNNAYPGERRFIEDIRLDMCNRAEPPVPLDSPFRKMDANILIDWCARARAQVIQLHNPHAHWLLAAVSNKDVEDMLLAIRRGAFDQFSHAR